MSRKLTDEEIKEWQKAVKDGFRLQAPELAEKKLPSVKRRAPNTIEARLDLHGLTIERAHHKFIEFVYISAMDDLKKLLIITGKGSAGQGKIRAELPKWCEVDYLKPLISSCCIAAPMHGGDGAFYVTLRT